MRPECPCEGISQSEHSPGLVGDDEAIVYAMIDPDTAPNSVARISKSKLDAGELSVARASYCTAAEAREKIVAPQLDRDSTRKDLGYLWAVCSEIRAVRLGMSDLAQGAFCVHDAALKDFPAHAHLACSAPVDNKHRNFKAAARGDLLKVFEARGVFEWAVWPTLPSQPE